MRAVKRGKDLILETQEGFKKNMKISDKMGKRNDEVYAASKEQAQGVGQRSGSEMDRGTQRNTVGTEELAFTAEQMNSQAMQKKGFAGDLAGVFGAGGLGIGAKGEKILRSQPLIPL